MKDEAIKDIVTWLDWLTRATAHVDEHRTNHAKARRLAMDARAKLVDAFTSDQPDTLKRTCSRCGRKFSGNMYAVTITPSEDEIEVPIAHHSKLCAGCATTRIHLRDLVGGAE